MADYTSLLMRAVANLPNSGTPATRGAIYERARKALLEKFGGDSLAEMLRNHDAYLSHIGTRLRG